MIIVKLIYVYNNMIENIKFLHILTSTLIIEMIMLFLFKFTNQTSKSINNWYKNLEWTAVILDVISIMIGFYLAKFIYQYLVRKKYIKEKNNYLIFLLILLIVQIIHDFSFYFLVIKPTKPGINTVIDEFKQYAKHYGVQAVIADSLIFIFTTPLLYHLSKTSDNINIFSSIVSIYIIGYLLYQKPLYI